MVPFDKKKQKEIKIFFDYYSETDFVKDNLAEIMFLYPSLLGGERKKEFEFEGKELLVFVFKVTSDNYNKNGELYSLTTIDIMTKILKDLSKDGAIESYNILSKDVEDKAAPKIIEFFIFYKDKDKFDVVRDGISELLTILRDDLLNGASSISVDYALNFVPIYAQKLLNKTIVNKKSNGALQKYVCNYNLYMTSQNIKKILEERINNLNPFADAVLFGNEDVKLIVLELLKVINNGGENSKFVNVLLHLFKEGVDVDLFSRESKFLYSSPIMLKIIPLLSRYDFMNKDGDTFFNTILKKSSKEILEPAISGILKFDKTPELTLNIKDINNETPVFIGIKGNIPHKCIVSMLVNGGKIEAGELIVAKDYGLSDVLEQTIVDLDAIKSNKKISYGRNN